ncbi:MAG TPA: hypothetical protein VGS03_21300 [Candidatus Polarisedimenticolia bacterium]|nr:hypothetical protein [Candidatus Polarisedimenticolia bacterium]
MKAAAVVTAAVLLLAPTLLRADEVLLKGGAKFSGRIESQTDTMITINIGDGVVGVPMARVDKVVRGHSPLDEYAARAKALTEQDAEGWRALGRWANSQGLQAQAREAARKVLVVLPDDPEARGALGYVKQDGRWMTEEESYKARGYVQVGGEWMTRAEAQQVQASAAAEQAVQDAERRANQAEADKILAEQRADKAEERAREAEEVDPWTAMNNNTNAAWYGGWGYGVVGWPSTATVTGRGGNTVPLNKLPERP